MHSEALTMAGELPLPQSLGYLNLDLTIYHFLNYSFDMRLYLRTACLSSFLHM